MYYIFGFFIFCAIFLIIVWFNGACGKKMSAIEYLSYKTFFIIWRVKNGPYAYSEIQAKDPDDALFQFRCKHPGRRLVACSTDLEFIRKRMSKLTQQYKG